MDDDRINKEFDDFLKKRYENHTIEPERALWDGINSRLYQKKTDFNLRKVRHLKVAVASLAMVLISTFIYFEIKTKNHQPEYQSVNQIEKTIIPPEKLKEKPLDIAQNNNYSTSQKHASDSVRKSDYYNVNKIGNNVGDKKITDISSTASKPDLKSDSLENYSSAITSLSIMDSSEIVTDNIIPPEKIDVTKYYEQGLLKLYKPNSVVSPIIAIPVLDKSADLQKPVTIDITQSSQKPVQGDLKLQAINQNLYGEGGSGTTKSGLKRFPFFIEGFVAPEISYRALVTNSQYSVPDYGKPYFNKTEKADLTFSAGISGGFGITDNIILKSGVFYSRYSYKFKTEAIHLVNNGTVGSYIYTSSGQVILSFISSDSISNESLIKSSMNYSYLNIPLVAELHFKNNYFMNIGLNFNMLVAQNMNWQVEDYNGDFTDATADPIDGLETGTISMIIGFGTEKPLAKRLSLILNPSLKICLTTINNTAPVKSYPYSLGLSAGLRYYFR